MKKLLALALTLWPLRVPGAMAAQDCGAPATVAAARGSRLQPMSRVKDYRIVLRICRRGGNQDRLAIRSLRIGGENLLLTVDPQSLTTRLDRAACWTCEDTTAAAQAKTRFIQAVDQLSQNKGERLPTGATWLDDAGLVHGRGGGSFITGDLCPSHRPLDRAFLQSLERKGEATPVALAISGLWLERHARDFNWLKRQMAEGRLAITFVNHSYRHPYRRGLPDAENYLLKPGLDMQKEILDVEKLLIANGATPSVFFRFPGLISAPKLMENLWRDHLIPLGADAWLALSPVVPPGGVILVHPNGNEPVGLRRFQRLRREGALPQPFRPINQAP